MQKVHAITPGPDKEADSSLCVRQQALNCCVIFLVNQISFAQMTLTFSGFLGQNMTQVRLRALEFARPRFLKTFGCASIGL